MKNSAPPSKTIKGALVGFLLCFLPPLVAQIPQLISQRPDPSRPTTVQAGLYYLDISVIDGVTETFTATAYLTLSWNDPRLKFFPDGSGRIRQYKPDAIWTPEVEVVNAQKLDDQRPPSCTVTEDGEVYYSRRVVVTLNNQMDLRRFPFDTQPLNFDLESARYGSDEVLFSPNPAQSGLARDIVSRGWALGSFGTKILSHPFAQTTESYSRIVFRFNARRNPTYFIWKIIFPTMVFVLLMWTIFWMQVRDVQTTLIVAITVLLTAVAFGNSADTVLPKPGYQTWLDQFQIGSFVFIVATVVETITVYALHHSGRTRHAERLRACLRVGYPVLYAVFCAILFLRAGIW